jgi:hypothetical protein
LLRCFDKGVSAPAYSFGERRDALTEIFGEVRATLHRFFREVSSRLLPVIESLSRVVISAPKVAPHLTASFWSQEHANNGARSQAYQEESDCGSNSAAPVRLVFAFSHECTSSQDFHDWIPTATF